MSGIVTRPGLDRTVWFLWQGYRFLPGLWQRYSTGGCEIRLLGERTICLVGAEAAELLHTNPLWRDRLRGGDPAERERFGHWADPEVFDPDRFAGREIGRYELVPQGGGDPDQGHRCAGEDVTVRLLGESVRVLAGVLAGQH